MPRRSSRRLAGCFAIDLLLAAGLFAADFEYRAGTATYRQATALVLVDRHGNQAAMAQGAFAVTRSLSDRVAVELLKAYHLERQGVVVRGTSAGSGEAADIVTAVSAALGGLQPAVVRFGAGVLSVLSADGRCLASIAADGSLAFEHCGGGELVRAPIRSAFQVVEPAHRLLERGEAPFIYPVQAIAFGRQVTILALGGDVPAGKFRTKGVLVVPFSNDSVAMPDDARVYKAIRQVLDRVK